MPNVQRTHPRHAGRRGLLVSLSVALHAAALAGLVAAAAWRIDKLEPQDPPLLVAAGIGAPLPIAGEEADEEPAPRPRRKRTAERAQPDARAMKDQAADEVADGDGPEGGDDDGDGDGDGPGDSDGGGGGGGEGLLGCPAGQSCSILGEEPVPACGNGRVEPGEACDDGNRARGDGCSPACRAEERVVAARVIEGQRVAGDPQIPAPPPVRTAMARAGQEKLVGSVMMCLSAAGRVTSLRVVRSTGYPEYDRLLTARMSGWRYRPYRLDSGAAVPVCTVVTFIYRTG